MGRGSYTATDWTSLRSSKGFNNASTTYKEIFRNQCAESKFDSRYVGIREARDNEDSKVSTPIIIGFDVTASMGYLAQELATSSINLAITAIAKGGPVSNPQYLTAAIGDIKCDKTPLQVTQFESDIRIIEQLTQLHLEGGGGGNDGESYNLVWYFAAKHTAADCFEKRHGKGFLFTIGDDKCHPDLSVVEIARAFNDEVPYSLSSTEILEMAEEKYHVCHIHINDGSYESRQIMKNLRNSFPSRVTEIYRNDLHDILPYLILSVMELRKGSQVNDILNSKPAELSSKLARPLGFMINNNQPGSALLF